MDGTAKMLTFFGLALDCIIFSSGLKALIRGAKEGKTSMSLEPSSAPGERDNAACMGGMKFFNSVSNVGTFIFTDVWLGFGLNLQLSIAGKCS